MKLGDIDPSFLGSGGEGPCGTCGQPLFLPFENPLDGGPPMDFGARWKRTGDSFETLTLEPSILRIRTRCGWHGYIRNGEIITC